MRKFEDTYRHKGLRKQLVDLLKAKGITDANVLQAIQNIPRHYFLDSALDQTAYEDRAFPIGEGQTISQPYTVAYQSQLLQVKQYDKILEIGTGSTYQACVLAEMQAQVFTIERQKKLFDIANQFPVAKKYPHLKFFYGDGFEGLSSYGPFDKIIITAAAPFTPPKLLQQLKVGGMMVIPKDEGDMQRMMRITKTGEDEFTEEKFDFFSFVPMLRGKMNEGG
jgi:protein-L-isoaspartate(D-aspartate) O-methyltransferase